MDFIDKVCNIFIKISPQVFNLFKIAYLALIVFVGILITTPYYPLVGSLFGEIAVLLYILSLVPGIALRLGVNHSTFNVIRIYRRHIGISMYLFAFSHMTLKRSPSFIVDFSTMPTYELMGTIALFIFMLLFLTSNNLSQKLLGVGWIYLQKLTYVGMFFVLLHLSVNYVSKWGMLMWLVIIAELFSFYIAARRR